MEELMAVGGILTVIATVFAVYLGILGLLMPIAVWSIKKWTQQSAVELGAIRNELETMNLKTHQQLEALDRIQELQGVRFAYAANRLWYEQGVWRIAPGHPDSSCACGTGVCKRALIEGFRAVHTESSVVHIGNGRVSDLCAALASDVVFAKDTLAEELAARGEAFEPFETLHDVLAGLERLHGRNREQDGRQP